MEGLKHRFKLWLETEEGYIFGQGAFELLQKISEAGTLSSAAEALGISYRHAWGIIKRIERQIGRPILKTRKGGKLGGGSELTDEAKYLMKEFLKMRKTLSCVDKLDWEGLFTKISARNRIDGEVMSVEKGEVAAKIKIKIETPCVITSLITREAAEDLGLKEGDKVKAVIKATEVMVSKET